MAEAPDDLLLVQVAGVGLQPADGLHVPVYLEGVLPRHRHVRGRAIVQLVELVGLPTLGQVG